MKRIGLEIELGARDGEPGFGLTRVLGKSFDGDEVREEEGRVAPEPRARRSARRPR